MATETNGCIFQWKIKNIPFSESTDHKIESPEFNADGLEGTKWVVWLYPRMCIKGAFYLGFFLRHLNNSGPDNIVINSQFTLLDKNGCILKEETKLGYHFMNSSKYGIFHFMRLFKEVHKDVFLPHTTHDRTVQCTIWNKGVKPVNPQQIHAQTDCSNGRHGLYYGTISPLHNQSCVTPVLADLKSMYREEIFSDMKLQTPTQTFPVHKNILSARSPVFRRMFSCAMKEKTSGHVDITDLDQDTVHRMLLYIYTDALDDLQFENACKLYVAADKYEILSLRSSCSSFLIANLSPTKAGVILSLADRHLDDELKTAVRDFILKHDKEVFRSQNWKDFMDANNKLATDTLYWFALCKTGAEGCSNGTFRHKLSTRGTSILSDLKSMYKEEIFCDMKLCTSAQTFLAHKNILSARSPVFRIMLSSDIEKNSGHIDITDLDEDTVHRMLLYIYTDALDDLQFESACKLYVAADKYEILSLRSSCSSFLIANLSPKKAGVILSLADRHQDDEMKTAVQDFIFKHDKEVFRSQDWKDFMDANNKLATDTLYQFALRKTGSVSNHRFSPY